MIEIGPILADTITNIAMIIAGTVLGLGFFYILVKAVGKK